MNKRILVLMALALVAALWMVRPNTKKSDGEVVELATRVFDPGIVISSDGAPADLQGFPHDAIVPLVQIISARSWSELAPYYSPASRLQAKRSGQAERIDSNRAKPFFYKSTIISETTVTLADGEALLIVQVVPREYLGNSDDAKIWRPTTLVHDSGRWLVDLRFEKTPLNWFLMNTKPSLLATKQAEFKAEIEAALAKWLPGLPQPLIYKEIKLDPPVEGVGDRVEMALQVLTPKVIFFGDKMIQGEPPPWALSKLAALNLTPEDIPKRFTPEYISEYGTPELGLVPPEIYFSITHGVFVKHKGYEYVFVSGSFSEDQSKLAAQKGGFGTAIHTTEGWKRTTPPKWTIAFPMNDAEKLQAILDRGAAQVVQGRMEPAPEDP